jgi:hypothetical protein
MAATATRGFRRPRIFLESSLRVASIYVIPQKILATARIMRLHEAVSAVLHEGWEEQWGDMARHGFLGIARGLQDAFRKSEGFPHSYRDGVGVGSLSRRAEERHRPLWFVAQGRVSVTIEAARSPADNLLRTLARVAVSASFISCVRWRYRRVRHLQLGEGPVLLEHAVDALHFLVRLACSTHQRHHSQAHHQISTPLTYIQQQATLKRASRREETHRGT